MRGILLMSAALTGMLLIAPTASALDPVVVIEGIRTPCEAGVGACSILDRHIPLWLCFDDLGRPYLSDDPCVH